MNNNGSVLLGVVGVILLVGAGVILACSGGNVCGGCNANANANANASVVIGEQSTSTPTVEIVPPPQIIYVDKATPSTSQCVDCGTGLRVTVFPKAPNKVFFCRGERAQFTITLGRDPRVNIYVDEVFWKQVVVRNSLSIDFDGYLPGRGYLSPGVYTVKVTIDGEECCETAYSTLYVGECCDAGRPCYYFPPCTGSDCRRQDPPDYDCPDCHRDYRDLPDYGSEIPDEENCPDCHRDYRDLPDYGSEIPNQEGQPSGGNQSSGSQGSRVNAPVPDS